VNVLETVELIETLGAKLRLEGQDVRVWFRHEQQRNELTQQIAFLRAHREEVADFLRTRSLIPPIPPGIRLISWELKRPPIAIETCALVTDPGRFAETTLDQLRVALANPRRWIGWSIPQLIDRLAQVGVLVSR